MNYAYVTSFFETKGIVAAQILKDDGGFYIHVSWPGWHFPRGFAVNKECFRTFEEAQVDCERRKAKQMKALQAKLKRLEAQSFDKVSVTYSRESVGHKIGS